MSKGMGVADYGANIKLIAVDSMWLIAKCIIYQYN